MSIISASLDGDPVLGLVVRTSEIADPGPLLALLPDAPVLSWVRRGEGLVGWGQTARFTADGGSQFADAEAWWRALLTRTVVRDDVGLGSAMTMLDRTGAGQGSSHLDDLEGLLGRIAGPDRPP